MLYHLCIGSRTGQEKGSVASHFSTWGGNQHKIPHFNAHFTKILCFVVLFCVSDLHNYSLHYVIKAVFIMLSN